MFTLRSKTSNAEAYIINAKEFLQHLETIDADKMNFPFFAQSQDIRWINKLAKAL